MCTAGAITWLTSFNRSGDLPVRNQGWEGKVLLAYSRLDSARVSMSWVALLTKLAKHQLAAGRMTMWQ